MATTGYGWTFSTNPADFGGLATIDCYGTKFRVRANLDKDKKDGILADLFRYLIFSFNRRVERIAEYKAGDDYSFYARPNKNNPSKGSEHGGAVAIDLNATQHPNGASSKYVGFTKAQVAEIEAMLAEVEDVIDWGGNWHRTIDPMHFDVISPTDAHKAKIRRVVTKLRSIMQADPTNYGLAPETVPAKPTPPKPVPGPNGEISVGRIVALQKSGAYAGDEGKRLQTALNAQGAKLVVDGYLGDKTKAAIAKLQIEKLGAKAGTSGADGYLGDSSAKLLGFTLASAEGNR